jgi:DNA-binding transcriptional regulator YiaG
LDIIEPQGSTYIVVVLSLRLIALLGIAQRQIHTKLASGEEPILFRRRFPVEIKTVRDLILQKRIEAGLTQQQLAAALGLSRRRIQSWEGGTELPSDDHWKLLGSVLRIVSLPPIA